MTYQYDNVRPLPRNQVSHRRSYGRLAKVIPLHPHLHDPRRWQAVGFSFLAMAVVAVLAAMLVVVLRSGNDFLGRLPPGWPW
jgi:hypothetical protein